MITLRNPDTDAVRWLAKQIPEKFNVGTRNRSCDICCCVSKTDWEYLRCGRSSEKRGAEWKDAFAIGRCTFRIDHYSPVWMFLDESLQVYEMGILWRVVLRMMKCAEHCMEQRDALYLAGGWI